MIKINGCNADLDIRTAYYPLSAKMDQLPVFIEMIVTIEGWTDTILLPIKQFNLKGITKKCPLLHFRSKKSYPSFDEVLTSNFIQGLNHGKIQRGYYLENSGSIIFPDGHVCFLRGSELIGSCNRPYMLTPEIDSIELMGKDTSLSQFLPLLLSSPPQVLLVFSYVVLSSIRSLLVENGIDLQAVLYIVGGQGLGKTTLATRVAGIYKKDGKQTGIIQAGSTLAAVNTILLHSRDQPVLVDDLCLSASKDTARKRIDLASLLIRQCTSTLSITKKSGNATVEYPCGAGLIMTAEFHLENLSDLTRCLIVPIYNPLNIPDEITPDLIGAAIRYYSHWFIDHSYEEIAHFHEAIKAQDDSATEARMFTNYTCLRSAFLSFIRSLNNLNSCSHQMISQILRMMDSALSDAQQCHQNMIMNIKRKFPVGNLAYCIYQGYLNNAFDLCEKPHRLKDHEGMIKKNDLCLRPEKLIQFVRNQSGYQEWKAIQITRELKDIGALVIEETGSSTVHIGQKKDHAPRVYRIRLNVLKEHAEKY